MMPTRIETIIIEGLADIRVLSLQDLLDQIAENGGELNMTAKEQSFVVPWTEDKLKKGELLGAKDFGASKKSTSCLVPVDGISVKELAVMFERKITS